MRPVERMPRLRLGASVLVLAVACATASPLMAQDAPAVEPAAADAQADGSTVPESSYQLGPQDVVRLRVAEWQTADASFRDWSSVAGDYSVSPRGTIAIPFIGEIDVTGKTTSDLGKQVGDELQQRFGLADRPEAVFEIATFRPIYVAGDVQTPGAYPYQPGLSIIKAMSIAGGQRRGADGTRAERDVVRSQGELAELALSNRRLFLLRARLQAEIDGQEKIALPKELEGQPEAANLLADEQQTLEADRDRIALQKQSLNELKDLLGNEIQALEGKHETLQRQVDLTKKELADVGSLQNKGLVVNSRVSELERRIADYEGRLLDIETSSLRAKQDISKADQDLIRLERDRRAEIQQQRQDADAQIELNKPKAATERGLLNEALTYAPGAARLGQDIELNFSIMRDVGGKTTEFAATEGTEVRPGDVVKVRQELPASGY